MSGDVSLAASVNWPDIDDFHDASRAGDRDSLDDDSRQIMAASMATVWFHIAWLARKELK